MQAAFAMAAIGALSAAGMLWSGLRKRRGDRYARASYTAIEAQVREVSQREWREFDDDGNQRQGTGYTVTYAYTVDGRIHVGHADYSNRPYGSVRVYYDRNRPDMSAKQVPVNRDGNSAFIVSACLLGFAAIFLGAGLLAFRQID